MPMFPMPESLRRRLRAFVLGLACVAGTATAQPGFEVPPAFAERMATRDTLDQLRRGGFVLYLRHGYTDNRRADRYPVVDPDDCSTQRLLSDAGRGLMREVGRSFREARIPVGEILVSPLCRTRESARLAFGDDFRVVESLMYSGNMSSDEKKPRLAALRRLLAAPVAPGTNRVLLAHAPNLADLIGFFVKPEGSVVIFAQRGEAGYEYVATLPPALWAELLRVRP